VTIPLVVGVTGGIGSGKSTVCREFEQLGASFIDADQVAREVVLPGTPGLAAVVAEFGRAVVSADGTLDRAALRRIVFTDPSRRARLEEILHPLIRARIAQCIGEVDGAYCLLAIPLLVEKGNYRDIDRVLVVDCPADVQISRVMARDHLTAEEVAAIMRTQATREERLAKADDVVTNSTDLEAIRAQVRHLHARYLDLARNREPANP
jgi:dephospho-CoA kinase